MSATPADGRYLGIDFSGDFRKWTAGCRRSNVWLAEGEMRCGVLTLRGVAPVQELPGDAQPFARLATLLYSGDFRAAAVDAPTAAPQEALLPALREAGHAAVLQRIDALPLEGGRPFPSGAALVQALAGASPPLAPPKPLRATERWWTARGVNVRSALWNGARPGAPLAAACMKLLARARRPLWPWCPDRADGLVAEGFPAAQLRQWGLPHQGYGGAAGYALRRRIVAVLHDRLSLTPALAETLVAHDDALDAALCLFGAVAAHAGNALPTVADAPWHIEGWIAVAP